MTSQWAGVSLPVTLGNFQDLHFNISKIYTYQYFQYQAIILVFRIFVTILIVHFQHLYKLISRTFTHTSTFPWFTYYQLYIFLRCFIYILGGSKLFWNLTQAFPIYMSLNKMIDFWWFLVIWIIKPVWSCKVWQEVEHCATIWKEGIVYPVGDYRDRRHIYSLAGLQRWPIWYLHCWLYTERTDSLTRSASKTFLFRLLFVQLSQIVRIQTHKRDLI